MKHKLLGLMLPLAGIVGLQAATQPAKQDYTQYVNPFVGTGVPRSQRSIRSYPSRTDTEEARLGLVFGLSLQRFHYYWLRTDAP